MDSELDRVLHLEQELQTPSVRRDRQRLSELLHPDFMALGESGRRWDATAVLDMVERGHRVLQISKLEARTLADGLTQVFWQSRSDDVRAVRMSLWKRADAGWRLIYHQATPTT